jgi:MinD-like ATPase involved in chromosome partitioning or flagellar assembly
MSSIVTFYSYKGGVGRSMALANIAVLLARRGLRVLVVDWDLEAPGLERYFTSFENTSGGPGLLRMCMDVLQKNSVNYKEYISFVNCDTKHPIALLTSGREHDESYSRNLEMFDWERFFSNAGGAFLEKLRQQWRQEYDIVLIDSRTGLSDAGGICTIFLPDVVVAMFTANYQSLYGVRDVMRLAQIARQRLAYDRMPLSILPLPARWGVQEFQESRVWLDRIAEALKEFFDDWLPKTFSARQAVEVLKVPQTDFFGFGEKLAVVEQGTSDPQGMGFVYNRVAAFLAVDFTDIGALLSGLPYSDAESLTGEMRTRSSSAEEETGYLYDLFVSYDSTSSEWVLSLVETLKDLLDQARIFIDLQEVRVGQSWTDPIQNALLRSKVLIAIVTPQYLSNQQSIRELATFEQRSKQTGKATLMSLLLRGSGSGLDRLSSGPLLDFRSFHAQNLSGKRSSSEIQRGILRLADQLTKLIVDAPAYDASWVIASEREASNLDSVIKESLTSDWRRRILWVDDRPDNNLYERRRMEMLGVTFTLAKSTDEAMSLLESEEYGIIISDMGRREGPTEGYTLLGRLRKIRNQTPFLIYAGSSAEKHKREALARGAQGFTNDPNDLIEMVRKYLP